MMLTPEATAMVSGMVAIIGTIIGCVAWIFKELAAVRSETGLKIDGAGKEVALKIDGLAKEARSEIEKVEDTASRGRHALAGQMQAQISGIDREMGVIRAAMFRRDEAAAMDTRFMSVIDKLEARMNRVDEKLGLLPALDAQMKSIAAGLDKIGNRLDQVRGA